MAMHRNMGIGVGLLVALVLAGCEPHRLPHADSSASSATPTVPQMVETEAPVRADGGTFVVPATVNGAMTLNFTIDSGASDVTIPKHIVQRLMEQGAVSDADYIGDQTFVLADGSRVPSSEFKIRTLKVGDLVLHDVTASLTGDDGSLLLGQTFLSRLSSWSIDNGRHVLILKADRHQLEQGPVASTEPGPAAATAPLVGVALMNEDTAKTLIQQYLAAWSSPQDPSGAGIRRFYASTIDVGGASTSLDTLMARKQKFAQAWPTRTYTPRAASMVTACTDKFTCTVHGVVDWKTVAGDGRSAGGSANFVIGFSQGRISSESGVVSQ